ncbi:hypothetical protein ACHWQZ_G011643 [Mnemiopsis leidyi]
MGVLKGTLRIHIIEAKGLLNKDNTLVSDDISDPYVSVDVGVTRVARTFVKDNTLNPRWNEVFNVDVNSKARSVTFKVKDRDVVGCDMLGWLAIEVDELLEEEIISGWFPLISPQGSQDCGQLRIEISFSSQDKNIPKNMYPLRKTTRRKSTIQVKPGESSWIDLYRDLKQAQDLIYISGYTLNPDLKLSRYTPCETLGQILLDRAEKGVQVLIQVQEPCYGSPCEYMCHLHDPERHLKLRFAASSVQVSVKPPSRDDHTTSFVLVDTSLENVNVPQRRLVGYFGGLDLVTGRWDTPAHPLFDTQRTLHRGDFYNPCLRLKARGQSHCQICGPRETPDVNIETSTCDSTGARLPWHDTTSRFEGRLAHDLMVHFEEEWLKHGPEVNFVEIDDEDYDLDNPPGDEAEEWSCCLLKSIGNPSNPTSSLKRRSTRRTRTKSIMTANEDVIQKYIISHIKKAKKFIYVECPILFRTKEPDGFTLNPILNEMVSRVMVSVENRTEFTIFLVIPELYIHTSNMKLASDQDTARINLYHRECITKMYNMIGNSISRHPGSADKHPTDYVQVYTLRNNGSSTPYKLKEHDLNIQSEMIFVHSQVFIVDDEHLILGTPTNQTQVSSRDYEVALALSQPGHPSVMNGPLPTGEVAKFRMSLWLEHMGDTQTSWTDPSSRECRERLKFIAQINRANHERGQVCESHLLEFCKTVHQNGRVEFYDYKPPGPLN